MYHDSPDASSAVLPRRVVLAIADAMRHGLTLVPICLKTPEGEREVCDDAKDYKIVLAIGSHDDAKRSHVKLHDARAFVDGWIMGRIDAIRKQPA